jgi:hypothetical protein
MHRGNSTASRLGVAQRDELLVAFTLSPPFAFRISVEG